MAQWWRRLVASELVRLRRDGRAGLLWSLRITVAATASYAVGTMLFPGTLPLLAPLTAMLVVQVTPVSLLASGLDRVVSVLAGVGLAVGFAAVVPLRWWSLGVLILVSITLGQILRLRANLIEVAISAMLVLGVGALSAESAAWQRIAETLVGAAVGILANLVFPPKVASSDAGHAIDGLADSVSSLLTCAADELEQMAADGAERSTLRTSARYWLDDSRRITHDIPRVGAALLKAEEGRRLNVRAVRTVRVEPGLRQGLEALEHSAVSIRGLMRSVVDAAEDPWIEGGGAVDVLIGLAQTFRQMAAGIDAFGELVRNEGDVHTELSGADMARLRDALEGLHQARARLDAEIAASPAPDVLDLHAIVRSTVRRILRELDLAERVRRELRLMRPSRRVQRPDRLRRGRGDLLPPAGPEDETQVLPAMKEEPPRKPPRR